MADEVAGGSNFISSLCHCNERRAVHVHCFCINCNGRAVNYRTQISHQNLNVAFSDAQPIDDDIGDSQEHINIDAEDETFNSINQEESTFENESHESSSNHDDSNRSMDSSREESQSQQEDMITEEENNLELNRMDVAIVKSIFEALDLIKETGASLNTLHDLLVFARHMFCRGRGLEDDDQVIKKIWPSDWESAKKYLVKLGYQDAKEYFICLDDSHKRHWDIMEKETDTCQHCGKQGTLKYYYLGLQGKVKHWVSSPEMCYKMTAHWREKEHWLNRERGWALKRELWDGDRFCELSWFWDPNSVWCLPVRCKMENCTNIIGGTTIEALPESPTLEGSKEVFCKECHSKFNHEPKYARGDPRNIALIAHWDGFQPFGNKKRSTGAIEVSVATMAKNDRLHTEEIYTVGFVPSYDLPDGRPNSLDPFLEPLVQDLEESFIEGYLVNYKGQLHCFPPGEIIIRLLLLLWTGDHPAQCEVCKSKGAGGKKGCKRCHLLGTWLDEERHYYYPGFREHFRHQWRKRVLEEEVIDMRDIEQEERTTYFQRKSRESGFNGLSQLHRLHPLYGFNVLTDFVIDAMHLLPLNIVKNHFTKLCTMEGMDERELTQRLKQMPWTTDYKSSRLPTHFEYLGFWKAEEYQKLAFPASEFLLHGLLTEDQSNIWAPVPRLVEFVFNAGRDGWTEEMIQKFCHLSWRYCILMEEHFGTQICVINLHNLIHFHEDISRFSSPDNFWCTQFERAVSRYVRQSSNRKYLEKTFARKESQREFLKFQNLENLNLRRTTKNYTYNREKVVATSIEGAKYLVKLCQNSPDATKVNQGVLIGSGQPHYITTAEKEVIKEYFNNLEFCISEFAESYRSAFLPMHQIPVGGKLYRTGATVLAKQENTDVSFHINDIFLVTVNDKPYPLIFGDSYQPMLDDAGNTVHHPLSDTPCIKPFRSGCCLHLQDIQREIMLFPYEDGNFAIVDPFRQSVPLPPVIVPVYPEVKDMILVKGINEEIWHAEVKQVLFRDKSVKGYFYVKHQNWNTNKLWVRESRSSQMDTINFGSLLGIANGEWTGNYWKES